MHQVCQPDTDELLEMANLFPRTTGLPMTVWVSPRENARHDVRVKVNMTHGDQMNIANTAIVGVRPSPHVVAGHLPRYWIQERRRRGPGADPRHRGDLEDLPEMRQQTKDRRG